MSKLLDKVKRIAVGQPQGMGFTAMAARARGPTMVLMSILPSLDEQAIEESIEAGVDALVVSAQAIEDPAALQSSIQRFGQCPWGLRLDGAQVPQLNPGLDFILFTHQGGLSPLREKEMGRFLIIDHAWSDARLRALDMLPIDSVVLPLAPPGVEQLTVEHLLEVQRLSLLLRKPLIGQLSCPLAAGDLESLRDGGLVGILVPEGSPHWAEALKGLRQAIDCLPPSKGRQQVDVILPSVREVQLAPEEEEE